MESEQPGTIDRERQDPEVDPCPRNTLDLHI